MSLLAVRRNNLGQVVFYKQEQNHVYYSFDRIQWFYAFSLPIPPSNGGNSYWDLSKSIDYYIEEHNTHYYQNTDLVTIINNFTLPINLTTAKEQIANVADSVFVDRKLCRALLNLLTIARELGLAVQNGQLEPDDAEKASQLANDLIPVAGGYIATLIDLYSTGVVNMGSLTPEQIEDYACCIYNALQGGEFGYDDFKAIGTACGLGAWDEIATPEMYAFFIAQLLHDPLEGECPCEECLVVTGASGEIAVGQPKGKALLSGKVNVSGNIFEMQARGTYRFPSMVLSHVYVYYANRNYENTPTNNPQVSFSAPNTGGGNNLCIPNTMSVVEVAPIQLPLLPVDNITLTLKTSMCSSCTTAQMATFDETYCAILFVKICGTLA